MVNELSHGLNIWSVCTAVDGMQTGSYDWNLVCQYDRLSDEYIVIKCKKHMFTFLYHMTDTVSQFSEEIAVCGGRPLQSEILGQPARVWTKSPIFNPSSLVAPHL